MPKKIPFFGRTSPVALDFCSLKIWSDCQFEQLVGKECDYTKH